MGKKKKKEIRTFDLKDIKDPHFVADLTYEELEQLAKQIREDIIVHVAKNGGHLSSNLGVVDLTLALNRAFNFNEDKLLFDVGHQAYTYKILTGRSLDTLRQKDGISGFQKISESPYDHFEAGHSSTSLSAAQGMAISRDLNGEKYDVVALIGDGAISNGLAFEALNDIGHKRNKVIIIVNDNEMSITPPTGALSKMFRRWKISPKYIESKTRYKELMFKTKFGYWIYKVTWNIKNWFSRRLIQQNFFEQLGFAYIGLIDGHDFKKMDKALKIAKKQTKSVIVHVKTTKGKGYPFAEHDKEGDWHGIKPFNIETGEPLKKNPDLDSWSAVYASIIYDVLDEYENTILINPATLKGSQLEKSFIKHPGRTIDVGIAEEHAFTLASGLALSNKHPIISIYSTFMQRSTDQIIHDLARMNLPATILVDRAGYVGADGETHHGIFDVAIFGSVPNVTISMASTPHIAKELVKLSLVTKGPFFIRYPRDYINVNDKYDKKVEIQYGKWLKETLNNGSKETLVISFGPYYEKLKEALKSEKKNITLINALFQRPLDEAMLKQLTSYKDIYIIDAYNTKEGFVNEVIAYLNALDYKGKIHAFALPNKFVLQATINEQLKEANISVEQIIKIIK
ncbi:MAG: 1-deoxy-D-xylulose-5-phosphate synthase [Bacilli bacterium]|jgi:1-deoxy-D-xylulose-5-phosphate synthase